MYTLFTPLAFLVMALVLWGCSSRSETAALHVSGGLTGGARAVAQTSLPEYARPRGRILDPADYDRTDVIDYRALKRSDFRGVNPPPDMAPYRDRLGATTCAYIVTTVETQVYVRRVRTSGGRVLYEGRPQDLGFRAEMDRSCSWWNSLQSTLKTDYILEHEQIHFALFELEARRLNAEVGRLNGLLKTTDSTLQGARQGVQSRLEEVLGKSLRDVLARSRAFDEETSMGYRPEQQKVWLRRVESELSKVQLAF